MGGGRTRRRLVGVAAVVILTVLSCAWSVARGGVGGGELAVGQLALALLRGSLELAFELRREFSLVEFSVCDGGMRCESSVSANTRAFLKLSKYTCRFAVRSQPFSQS